MVGGLGWCWLTELQAAEFPAVLLLRKAPQDPTGETPAAPGHLGSLLGEQVRRVCSAIVCGKSQAKHGDQICDMR